MIFNDPHRNTWELKIIKAGDAYGLDNCLTHDGEPMVEFWTESGYFVTRYYVSTLLKRTHPGQGLCLQGDMPEYNVSAACYEEILDWLEEV